ncbi:MAG: protoporphyrinogen oxidase HemJ [Candidatus Liberibacter europaeus]|uniref:Protoporphyrinogen IX oxidase n=1 Tax=Candidatus Liberibacter europaeus TaxID=744859 RepID=A0A2T4VYZ4_9HYPH|nr:protoporphyrinogen oxidase HemJ [Candidatus Liberibacter europaeus]PTL86997.1 MAG: protoporphyrinogen oxidase HemJ [Candidatus Liberibacter europaeus]
MKFLVSDQSGKKAQAIAYISLFIFLIVSLVFFFFFTSNFFLCIKSIHIISVISWMAGLLYMPRIFVYHSYSTPGTDQYKVFEIMEERLLKVIMNPAMILSWICGLYMIYVRSHSQIGWFRLKLVFTFILSAYHLYLAILIKDFKNNLSHKDSSYFKIINEIPTIIMIIVVFLSVVRPF